MILKNLKLNFRKILIICVTSLPLFANLLVAANPNSSEVNHLLSAGLQALGKGNAREALKNSEAVIKLDPKNGAAHQLRAVALWQTGQFKDIILEVHVAEYYGIRSALIYETAGKAALRIGRPDLSIGYLEKMEDIAHGER